MSPIYYLYIFIFLFAMLLSSTAPDIDVERPYTLVRKRNRLTSFWFSLVKGIAYFPLTMILSLSKKTKTEIGHRRIFHSIFGLIFYCISIIILFMIILTIIIFLLNYLSNPSGINQITTNSIFSSINSSILLLKHYWQILGAFIIGSAAGFLSHLYEDSTTVSGINYFPFIIKWRLRGRLKTGNKEFYSDYHVRFYNRSSFGAAMFWIFNLGFLIFYFNSALYLLQIYETLLIYLLSSFVFLLITCNMRPSRMK